MYCVFGQHEQYLEEATFSAAVAWTKHNPEGRAGLFLKLLSMVDLSLLSGSFLNRTVKIEVSLPELSMMAWVVSYAMWCRA